MPHNVHFVFSRLPQDVSESDYDAFYARHIDEILETEGFAAARRYWLAQGVPGRAPIRYRHLALYLLEREPAPAMTTLDRRMAAGELTIPDWFSQITFASFDGRPLEGDECNPPDHGYLVLSHAPRRFTSEQYEGWYYAHARENLTSDGFETVRRFTLTGANVDPEAGSVPTHGALYTVTAELPALRAALDVSFQAGRVDVPDWMAEGEFTSYDCLAAGPVRGAVPAG